MEITSLIGEGGHEQVVAFADPAVGLRGMIAVHSTALGPALGGIRFWHYERERDALVDVLALSAAMTRKAAIAGLHQGGGKAVVLWDGARRPRDDAFRRALGRAVHLLGGRYIAAEDVGATQADMDGLARETPWVTGVDPARGGSGDPSPVTAWGVLHAMQAACEVAFGRADMVGARVLVQGVGKVGAELARLLHDRGADVSITDIDTDRVAKVGAELDVDVVPPQHALTLECDVLAPCALGGELTVDVVRELRCSVVCGAANNQLADADAVRVLADRDIVFVPDFVASAGGIINIAHEWEPGGYSRADALAAATGIEATTRRVLVSAREQGMLPTEAADALARARLETEGGSPYVPGDPSVMRDALLARWSRFR